MNSYPYMWVCHDCGTTHGKQFAGMSTWHQGICGICLNLKPVTDPRDYGYPIPKENSNDGKQVRP